MSRIKWERAKALISSNYKEIPADWPERFAPLCLATLQAPSRADWQTWKSAIESSIADRDLPSIQQVFVSVSAVRAYGGAIGAALDGFPHLAQPVPEYRQTLPAIAADDFRRWLESQGEKPSEHIQAWFDACCTEPEHEKAPSVVLTMPIKRGVIELPAGTKHVRFEELPHLIASALVPIDESSSDENIFHFSEAEVMLQAELDKAVESGELPAKNPRTLGPYIQNGAVRLDDCVVLVQDLRRYVAGRGLSVEVQEDERKPRSKKTTWRDVSLDYVLTVLAESKSTTAKALFNALERKAGPDSPFEKGTGDNRGSLIVRKINEPLSLKTLQNAWTEIKAGTPKG